MESESASLWRKVGVHGGHHRSTLSCSCHPVERKPGINLDPKVARKMAVAIKVPVANVTELEMAFDGERVYAATTRQVWTRSRQHWVPMPGGVPAFEKSSRGSS